MTSLEAVEMLYSWAEGSDEEIVHAQADKVLLSRLLELGDGEVVAAYQKAKERVGFWYA
jgi:hypothetical protein